MEQLTYGELQSIMFIIKEYQRAGEIMAEKEYNQKLLEKIIKMMEALDKKI